LQLDVIWYDINGLGLELRDGEVWVNVLEFLFVLGAHVVYLFKCRRGELFVEGELRGQGKGEQRRKEQKVQKLKKFLFHRLIELICYNLRVL
jgi:hypothetical protein